jgi:predicted nucleic acid-binding Zn ribbon protein
MTTTSTTTSISNLDLKHHDLGVDHDHCEDCGKRLTKEDYEYLEKNSETGMDDTNAEDTKDVESDSNHHSELSEPNVTEEYYKEKKSSSPSSTKTKKSSTPSSKETKKEAKKEAKEVKKEVKDVKKTAKEIATFTKKVTCNKKKKCLECCGNPCNFWQRIKRFFYYVWYVFLLVILLALIYFIILPVIWSTIFYFFFVIIFNGYTSTSNSIKSLANSLVKKAKEVPKPPPTPPTPTPTPTAALV